MNNIILALLAVVFWLIGIYAMANRIRRSKHFSLYGPALMVKTSKNRNILDRIASRFPAVGFSKLSVAMFLIWGILSLAFLIYEAYLISQVHVATSPPLNEYLAIPGINPAIPVIYGTVALFIAVVLHEMMHGVVARKHGINVKSVGGLFFIVPLGAFVEPDQDEISKADPVVRRRIFASGAGINIIITLVSFLLIVGAFMPAAQPTHSGFYVSSVDSAFSQNSSLTAHVEVLSIGGVSGEQLGSLYLDSQFTPGKKVSVQIYSDHRVSNLTVPAGVVIDGLYPGFPAAKAGVPPGSIVYALDGVVIKNLTSLSSYLDSVKPLSFVNLTVISYSGGHFSGEHFRNYTLQTVSKYSFYQKYEPSANSANYRGESFIGIAISYMGMTGIPIGQMKPIIFGYSAVSDFPVGIFQMLSLPFQGLSPVPSYLTNLFTVPGSGWFFWGSVNTLYWLFYINLLLALLNTLPAAILDGGQFFKDTFKIASRHRIFKSLRDERLVTLISNSLTMLVVFLFFYMIIGPRIS